MRTTKPGSILQISILISLAHIACSYDPPDNYRINCGSNTSTTVEQRLFLAEAPSPTAAPWTISAPGSFPAGTPSASIPSSGSSLPLYQTARVFPSQSSYAFPIRAPGRHLVRLYFFPFGDLAGSSFTVSTEAFTLLHFLTAGNPSASFREYSVTVKSSTLTLFFTPSKGAAFVNAIEVVSLPPDLVPDAAQILDIRGRILPYSGLSFMALETIYRVNVGGQLVSPSNDTLWRTWHPDSSFLSSESKAAAHNYNSSQVNYASSGRITPDIAPPAVYGTAVGMLGPNVDNVKRRLTWGFGPLEDTTAQYLVRLHFCDIVSRAATQTTFNVSVGNSVAIADLQLSVMFAQTLKVPYYADFVAQDYDGSGVIQVGVQPSRTQVGDPNAFLNGVEIFKLNNSLGSLSGMDAPFIITGRRPKKNLGIILGVAVGGFSLITIMAITIFVIVRKKNRKPKRAQAKAKAEAPPSEGLRLPLALLEEATNQFDQGRLIGEGGFGKVYMGLVNNTMAAIKRGKKDSDQGRREFYKEITLLAQLRLQHRHLVSLIGYCDEGGEKIIVYEYMENGSLSGHLHGKTPSSLITWEKRLEICIGASEGLNYLHNSHDQRIIHRDVKSANILLDGGFAAKVSDFGISKVVELDASGSSYTSLVGTDGYMDPEFLRTGKYTEKSDVYSFGVVMLEVLCGRPAIDKTLPGGVISLAEWAAKCLDAGRLDKIVDPRVAAAAGEESLAKFAEVASRCLADEGERRPSMEIVSWSLNYALQLQRAASSGQLADDNSVEFVPMPPTSSEDLRSSESRSRFPSTPETSSTETTREGGGGRSVGSSAAAVVFSQLAIDKTRGR